MPEYFSIWHKSSTYDLITTQMVTLYPPQLSHVLFVLGDYSQSMKTSLLTLLLAHHGSLMMLLLLMTTPFIRTRFVFVLEITIINLNGHVIRVGGTLRFSVHSIKYKVKIIFDSYDIFYAYQVIYRHTKNKT